MSKKLKEGVIMDKFIVIRNQTSPAAFKPIQIRVSTHEMLKQMESVLRYCVSKEF